ncbi:hypothetical protein C8R46DRAFT_1246067 [Mycena filopes]|nr:hypothetical protein C8R46DRAFT_1246067 [Mycena filopes]
MLAAGGMLPPTTHFLLGDERTRMMRSARKLGAVMGTTPLLVDLDGGPQHSMGIILPPLTGTSSPHRRSSKREGVLFATTSSRSSTCSSEYVMDKSTLRPEQPAPPPPIAKLSLSRETRNSLNSVTRLRLVLTLTQPSSSSGLGAPYPYPYSSHSHAPCRASSSTDSVDIDTDTLHRSLSILISTPTPTAPALAARRRKMVKLVHMLGGPIPPALVFPPPPPSAANANSNSRSSRAGAAAPDRLRDRRRSRSVPPPASASSAPTANAGPRKLVRPQHAEEPILRALPALSVDRIGRPRPLAAYVPLRSASSSPMSGTVSSSGHGHAHGRTTPSSYGLRRRGRESTMGGSES